jgi:TATA-box binding protein (TBP) (component of TFIID and TFIIIB)
MRSLSIFFKYEHQVHTGSKTEDHARLAANEIVYFLNRFLGIPASVNNFQITNMVANFKVGYEIDLHNIKAQLGSNAEYNPKKFPACRMTSMKSKNRKALIYMSGAIVEMGLKDRTEISQLQKEVWQVVSMNRLNSKATVSKREYRLIQEEKNVEEAKIKMINKQLKVIESMTLKKEMEPTALKMSRRFTLTPEQSYSRSLNPLNPVMALTGQEGSPFVPQITMSGDPSKNF